MDPIVKVLVLKNESKVLVTKIKEVQSELGEPDCQLTDPVEFRLGEEDWLIVITDLKILSIIVSTHEELVPDHANICIKLQLITS